MALSDGEISDGLLLTAVEVGLVCQKKSSYSTRITLLVQCHAVLPHALLDVALL